MGAFTWEAHPDLDGPVLWLWITPVDSNSGRTRCVTADTQPRSREDDIS